jgi:hypothetical protein
MDKTCENCRYHGGGLCRRNPPTTEESVRSPDQRFAAVWPKVSPSDWCGEWNYIPLPTTPMEVE